MIKRAIKIKYWTFIKSVNKFPPFCAGGKDRDPKQEQERPRDRETNWNWPLRAWGCCCPVMVKVVVTSPAEGSPSVWVSHLFILLARSVGVVVGHGNNWRKNCHPSGNAKCARNNTIIGAFWRSESFCLCRPFLEIHRIRLALFSGMILFQQGGKRRVMHYW